MRRTMYLFVFIQLLYSLKYYFGFNRFVIKNIFSDKRNSKAQNILNFFNGNITSWSDFTFDVCQRLSETSVL